MLSGFLAAVAGIMLTARIGAAIPSMAGHLGFDWLLPAFLAPVIGGTLLSGGKVTVFGTMLGAVLVTLINNVDYQSKIIYLDSMVLISLDTYLGKNHEIYNGIPNYIKYDMDISFLSSHIADKFLDRKINYPNERTFLSQMLYYGKKLSKILKY